MYKIKGGVKKIYKKKSIKTALLIRFKSMINSIQ
jgi:hypothetical protein